MYSKQSFQKLESKTGYENWVLDFLYDQIKPFPKGESEHVLKQNGNNVAKVTAETTRISQSRVNEIIENLYPLIFTTCYKNIDMQMEWILEEEQSSSPNRFVDKINDVNSLDNKGNLTLPPLYRNNRDIFDRIFALYDNLRDHRNEIVHREDFEVKNEELQITDGNNVTYTFNSKELFAYSKAVSITSKAIISNGITDEKLRELKTYLNILKFVHNKADYQNTPVWGPTIVKEIRFEDEDAEIQIDMEEIWEAFNTFPDADGFFLNVKDVSKSEEPVEYRIPSDRLPEEGEIELNTGNWSEFRT